MRDHIHLADTYLPTYDVRDYHATHVAAPVDEAYAALRSLDLSRSFLIRTIFAIRTLPSRFRGEPSGAPRGPFLEQTLRLGWVVLEERPGEELLAGAVTQPWEPVVRFKGYPPDEFVAFDEPGFAKIVWGLGAWEDGDGSKICIETRVQMTDPASRRKFNRYWLLVGLGIRLIRPLALRLVKRDLSRRSPRT